jgi:hypothetical protein
VYGPAERLVRTWWTLADTMDARWESLTSGGSLLRLGEIAWADGEPSLMVVWRVVEHDRAFDDGADCWIVRWLDALTGIAHEGDLNQAEASCSPADVEEEAESVMGDNHALDDGADGGLSDELVPLVLGGSDSIPIRCPLVRARRHGSSIDAGNAKYGASSPGAEWVTNRVTTGTDAGGRARTCTDCLRRLAREYAQAKRP